jgi:hypothetical protein
VRTAAEYRTNAEACRKLAMLLTSPEQKKTLLHMAETWDKLAKDRERDPIEDEAE